MQTSTRIKTALISVSDKTGIVEFAKQLTRCNITIIATGGTATLLKQNSIPLTEVSNYTGYPEIMGGRVKTLHPKLYGGILGRREQDASIMQQMEIDPIDLVVVNLYPFAATIAKPNCSLTDAVEQIDIGGPSMLRAAAKNFNAVTVITDPKNYPEVLQQIQQQQHTSLELRRRLAQAVFTHTAAYDQLIADYLAESKTFPESLQTHFKLRQPLRYGENPHQEAAFYTQKTAPAGSLASAKLLQGKPLSYNNLVDADCALQCAQELDANNPGCVIVKHATPCGVAQAATVNQAYSLAYRCDPESAFGGIIAFNREVDLQTATAMTRQHFIEVLIAPQFATDALTVLAKKPNLRVLTYDSSANNQDALALHSVSGGLLVQQVDSAHAVLDDLCVASERQPTAEELNDLLFAWRVVKFTKSNAIVYAKNRATLGIGTGQTSRVFAAKIASLRAELANLSLQSAVLASDAFFPFADGVEVAAKQGITAIIQPGGSKRDNEVIAAANAANMAMVFTGTRHFRH